MTVVSAPYCATSDVAFLLSFQRGGQGTDYSFSSSPTSATILSFISMVASRIDMAYMSVGYQIPFTSISGETWPTAQTTFLQYFNSVGVAAFMGGNVPAPPVVAPGRSRPGTSLYRSEWEELVAAVKLVGKKSSDPTLALLRAQTYNDSGAQWRLQVSQPMTTDFLEGYYDPTKYDMLHSYTERMRDFYADMGDIAPASPDYMWVAHQRLGFTYAT